MTGLGAGPGRRTPLVLLTASMVVATVGYLYLGRDQAPFYDEWTVITLRQEWDAAAFLHPHNGHLFLVPVLLQKIALEFFGLQGYWVLRILAVVAHVTVAGLVYAFSERRIGSWAALLAAIAILGLGAGSIDVLWAFQLSFLLSTGGGTAALIALTSEHRRAPLAAACALTVAVASSGIGVPFLAGAIVVALLDRRRANLIAVGIPLALYAIWFLMYGRGEGQARGSNIPIVADYAAQMASAAFGGLFGLDAAFGHVLLVLAVVGAAIAVGRTRAIDRGAIGAGVALAVLWGLTGLSRAHLADPGAARYIYPGAVLIVLGAVALLSKTKPTPRAHWIGAAIIAFGVAAGLPELRDHGRMLRDNAAILRSQLAAYETLETKPSGDFLPAPEVAPQINAKLYEASVKRYGELVPDPGRELATAYSADAAKADDTLIRAGAIATAAIDPNDSAPRPAGAAIRAVGGNIQRQGVCFIAKAATTPAIISLEPGQRVVLRADAQATVGFARFGDAPTSGARPIPARTPILLTAAHDRSSTSWRAQFTGASVRVCGA